MLILSNWQPLSCFRHNRQHSIQAVSQRRDLQLHRGTFARFGFSHLDSYGNLQKSLTCAHWGVLTEWVCVCTLVFPQAHIQCHHSSNQPPRKPDWIINYPINASLHSVRLSASKYLLIQNNPRRLDYHFKLLLCAVHNQERSLKGADGEESLVPPPHFHAELQTSYASWCWWGVCV